MTYATGHGSTTGVAATTAEAFRGTGAEVDLAPVAGAPDPAAYTAVVIGSPIRYDTWLPAAPDCVLAHQSVLATRPVAYFFTCIALSIASDKGSGAKYADAVRAICPIVQPVRVGRFAGVLDLSNFSVPTRVPARLMFRYLGAKPGDYRDIPAIQAWALEAFATQLSPNDRSHP
ncbi:MAG: flavodoxin domain-containing protein [Pseudomonadota bacterium]